MALELQPYDVLDHMTSDEDLAFLLNDALESGEATYIDHIVATLERARQLPIGHALSATERLVRAAAAVGLQLVGVPRIDDDKRAA